MTTIPMKSIRTLVKRVHGTRGFIFINANGAISDLVTVTAPTDAQPYGDWYVVNPDHREDMLAADELGVTKHCVTARLGERLVVIAEPDKAFAHTPRALNPKDTSITVHAHEGRNALALKALKSATARAGSISAEQDDLDAMRVQGQVTDQSNPALQGVDAQGQSVAAMTTDKYRAVLAVLAAEPAQVDAVVPGSVIDGTAPRTDWTMTITHEITTVSYATLGVTVTTPNRIEGKYPQVMPLFRVDAPSTSAVTASPKAFLEALTELPPKADPVVLTSSGTVYAEDAREVAVAGAVAGADASPFLGVDPKYLKGLLRAVGAKWPEVTLRWVNGRTRMVVEYGDGIVGLMQPRRDSFVPSPVDVEAVA